MIQEIEIPSEVPVMTLHGTVLFPQAMMPLYIFEPRYRQMLRDILDKDRIFAIAARDEHAAADEDSEISHSVAGIGIIRACQTNEDGTSNLIIQGIARVGFESILSEDPYRLARIKPIASYAEGAPESLSHVKTDILRLIQTQIRLGAPIPQEVLQFLNRMAEPEGILDLAIYTLCHSFQFKQRLLETQDILSRHRLFQTFLRNEIAQLKLDHQLRGGLDKDDIGNN